MRKRSKPYQPEFLERLKDPKYAAGYLNAVLADKDEEVRERFLLALGDVAKAHGMTKLAKETDFTREAMYRTLSKDGNPEFETLTSLLKAVGLRLFVKVDRKLWG